MIDIPILETKIHDAIVNSEIAIAPMAIIKYLMKLVDLDNTLSGLEKKELVIKILEKICAGKDGIMGTDDDLVSEHIVEGITALIRSGVIDEVITLLHAIVPVPLGIFGKVVKHLLRWLSKI
jgi:hypothetical protein